MREWRDSHVPRVLLVLDEGRAWSLLLRLAAAASEGAPVLDGEGVALDAAGRLSRDGEDPWVVARDTGDRGWEPVAAVAPGARRLLDLFFGLCTGPRAPRLCVAHLAQSLDGRVATDSGASRFITGDEDLRHTHRLRALFDAVVVGVQTVVADDPALTTRRVAGGNPARVVLDPSGRLPARARVLHDAAAPTVVVRGQDAPALDARGHVSELRLPAAAGCFDVAELVGALAARGLGRLFVEGGGVTVSRMLSAGALHRLQVAVAPIVIGSGSPSFSLPPVSGLEDALQVRPRRFDLGDDVLFDCEL